MLSLFLLDLPLLAVYQTAIEQPDKRCNHGSRELFVQGEREMRPRYTAAYSPANDAKYRILPKFEHSSCVWTRATSNMGNRYRFYPSMLQGQRGNHGNYYADESNYT